MLVAKLFNLWGLGGSQPLTAATTPPPGAAMPGIRHTLVLIYIALATAALLPGLAIWTGISLPAYPLVAAPLASLREALGDIWFGRGLRFWLGVTGAAMLALLLLYPLRKALFTTARVPGSVGGWFHLHIVLGLIGPVLILYHTNFSHGGFNANVALWTMLAITVSGIVGFFVYARVSRDFYVTSERARQHRKTLIAALPDTADPATWKDQLTADLEAFEADVLTPRQGLIPCLHARFTLERRRHVIALRIAAYIDAYARSQSMTTGDYRRFRSFIGGHVRVYFALARSSVSQSIGEQLWARWRLFHMPLFVIMVGATILHVIAVWGMDAGDGRTGPSGGRASDVAARTGSEPEARSIGDLLKRDRANDRPDLPVRDSKSVTAEPAIAVPPRAVVPPGAPVLLAKPQIVTSRTKPVQESQALSATGAGVPTVATPLAPPADPIPRPRPPVSASAFDPAGVSAGSSAGALTSALPAGAGAATSEQEMGPIYAELQKRVQSAPMGLGLGGAGTIPSKLEDQFVHFKTLMTAGQFSHSETETGFALTGKHLKAECSACHKTTLRMQTQSAPRDCLTCHKSDDIHKGRRPDCANCHTTNRWTQILKRK